MLPDYPETKAKLSRVLLRHLSARLKEGLGPLADVPPHRLFEGTGLVVERKGRPQRSRPMKRIGGKVELTEEDVEGLTLGRVLEKIDEMALQLAEGQSVMSFKVMAEDLEEAGQSVNARGQPLNPDTFFEVLEKIQVDFDAAGRAKFPTLVVGPAMAERAAAVIVQIQADPVYRRRFESILATKKADFDVREASRELVG